MAGGDPDWAWATECGICGKGFGPDNRFPPSSISVGVLSDSPTPYTCPWKGVAQYHDISVAGSSHHGAAWSYPDPYPTSFDHVGKGNIGYVAFDKQQVTIAE